LILWGKDFTQFYNDSFIDFQGLAHPTAIGADVSISHPALWQDLKDVISDTLKGDSYKIPHYKWPVQNINISNNSSNHFALSFTPLRDDDGLSVGVILTINRSENDLINDAEQKFREMMMYSPVCMAVLTGPEHVIDIANDSMLEKIWHKKLNEVQGRPLTEIFPELKEQHYPTVLDLVYTTGQYFRDNESVAYLYNNGEIFRFYVDVEYAPLKNSEGEVEGVIVTATDVTEKVEARKKAEDAETRLRLAIEATQLAIWDLDLKTKEIISQ
jgi:PAS domain S-box-containing protein